MRRSRFRRRSRRARSIAAPTTTSSMSTGCRTAAHAREEDSPRLSSAAAGQPRPARADSRATPRPIVDHLQGPRAARPEPGFSLTLPLRPSINGRRGSISMQLSRRGIHRRSVRPRARQPARRAGVRAGASGLGAGSLPRSALMAEAHRRCFGLPGLTLGADHARRLLDRPRTSALPNADARTPITPDTLFQIGSISKSMTRDGDPSVRGGGAAAARPTASATSLPGRSACRRQRRSPSSICSTMSPGCPTSAPVFARGGLWTAYAPGAHWHYSNTGYDILGKLAEHVGGKPLAQLLARAHLRARSACAAAAARSSAPTARSTRKAMKPPTDRVVRARGAARAGAWVDVTFGAGSVASTADDMIRFLRSLADAAQGTRRARPSPQQAKSSPATPCRATRRA